MSLRGAGTFSRERQRGGRRGNPATHELRSPRRMNHIFYE